MQTTNDDVQKKNYIGREGKAQRKKQRKVSEIVEGGPGERKMQRAGKRLKKQNQADRQSEKRQDKKDWGGLRKEKHDQVEAIMEGRGKLAAKSLKKGWKEGGERTLKKKEAIKVARKTKRSKKKKLLDRPRYDEAHPEDFAQACNCRSPRGSRGLTNQDNEGGDQDMLPPDSEAGNASRGRREEASKIMKRRRRQKEKKIARQDVQTGAPDLRRTEG